MQFHVKLLNLKMEFDCSFICPVRASTALILERLTPNEPFYVIQISFGGKEKCKICYSLLDKAPTNQMNVHRVGYY